MKTTVENHKNLVTCEIIQKGKVTIIYQIEKPLDWNTRLVTVLAYTRTTKGLMKDFVGKSTLHNYESGKTLDEVIAELLVQVEDFIIANC